jgi:hypothetical protein
MTEDSGALGPMRHKTVWAKKHNSCHATTAGKIVLFPWQGGAILSTKKRSAVNVCAQWQTGAQNHHNRVKCRRSAIFRNDRTDAGRARNAFNPRSECSSETAVRAQSKVGKRSATKTTKPVAQFCTTGSDSRESLVLIHFATAADSWQAVRVSVGGDQLRLPPNGPLFSGPGPGR